MEHAFLDGTGYPSILLMEHAAQAVVRVLGNVISEPKACVLFVCGGGNNGGDGFAAARLHVARGGAARVICTRPIGLLRGDALTNAQLLTAMGVELTLFQGDEGHAFIGCEAIVDGLFGTGLDREVLGDEALLIEAINESRLPVVAADIPSGVDGRTGKVLGCAVHADHTVTFHRPKTGHYLYPGRALAGELHVEDIGIFPQWDDADGECILSDDDVEALLPRRTRDAHKGSAGRALIVAGSRGMAGAAALCAMGCVRSGAGLTRIALTQDVLQSVQSLCSCATAQVVPQQNGVIGVAAKPIFENLLGDNDALALGPGLGTRGETFEAIKCLIQSDLPKVIDADALNMLAEKRDCVVGRHSVLTPHPGEMARLCRESIDGVLASPIEYAIELARRCEAVVLLKGATTIITDGEDITLNITGCEGMAKGGSGDVLTGVITSLLAQGLGPYDAARVGAFLHGRAGERAGAKIGMRQMTAEDLALAL